jgi:putative ABC transport system permease protein
MWFDSWFRRRWERRMDKEFRFHVDSITDNYVAQGLSREEARDRARREFGPMELAKDECRDIRTADVLEQTARDVSYSVRCLLRAPAFSLSVVLTLALGIGANTAVFSVVKAVLLNQLPYRDPQRLVALAEDDSGAKRPETIGYATAYDWRRLNHTFDHLSLYSPALRALTDGGEPELLNGLRVNYDFFEALGVSMQLGRAFQPEEDRPDTRFEVILSDGLWRRRFGGDPSILGRTLRLSDSSYTVTGVLPPGFQALKIPGTNGESEIFMPLGYDLTLPYACRDCQHLHLLGQLKAGVTADQGRADLDAIMAALVKQYPNSYPPAAAVALEPLHEYVVGRVSTALWIAFGAVALVLLIACANVANLMLARGMDRAREVALRSALGAARGRLIRQLLIESLVLALTGGCVGLVLAWWGVSVLAASGPREIPRLNEVHVEAGTLLFAFSASVLTAMLSGLIPAARATGFVLNDALKELKRANQGRGHHQLRGALVAVELALAFALVTGGGLLARSLLHILNVDPGYDPEHVLTVRTYVYGEKYKNPEAEVGYYREILTRVSALPGVDSAAMTSLLPLVDFDKRGFHIRDRRPRLESEVPSVDTYSVTADYFRTMKIPILRGHPFARSDGSGTPKVAIISDICARQIFPHEEALGRQIQLGGRHDDEPWATIVGISGDIRQYGLEAKPGSAAYILQSHDPSFGYSLVVRTNGDPASMASAVRAAFRAVDPTQPVFNLRPMESYLTSSLAQRRFILILVGLFGTMALALAAIGVYGVLSYTVSTRTRDFGIRMALGAERGDVVRTVLRHGAAPVISGLAAGCLLSLSVTRVLNSLLFEVKPADPATYALVAPLLAVVALLACYLPARRAAKVDPAVSLRYE